MSKLEDLVVSLETAIGLAEAGIEADSVFSWFHITEVVGTKGVQAAPRPCWLLKNWQRVKAIGNSYPAPTSEELEQLLTDGYVDNCIKLFSHYNDCKTMIEMQIFDKRRFIKYVKSKWYKKKSDALAEILIELKKES